MSEAQAERATRDRGILADALVRAGRGDRDAFAEVYRLSSAKLFGICLRILGSRSEAEDALQDIFVSVWRKASSFDPERASPITWLAVLARNKAIDRLRSRSARPSEPLGDDALSIADPAPAASDRIAAAQDARRLENCLGELEERQAGIIRRAFFAGATYAELAGWEGVPLGTMKSWIRRGLLRLRECLQR